MKPGSRMSPVSESEHITGRDREDTRASLGGLR